MITSLPRAMALAWAVLAAAAFGSFDPPHDGVVPGCTPSPRPSHHTATGTMAAYDPGARALTVDSVTGSIVYRVASDARAWLGQRRLPLQQLASHVGAQVTVAWTEVDGVRTTHTVRLEEPRAGRGH
jgi:hypothetical protein